MRKLILFLAGIMALALPSCDGGEDVGGGTIFIILLIVIVFASIMFNVINNINDKDEAEHLGMSVDAYRHKKDQEKAKAEKEQQKSQELSEQQIGVDIEYLGGYPKWATPGKVNFSLFDGEIKIFYPSKGSLILNKDNIVSISNEKSSKRSVGKAAAGAIVGGVLTGGIGLIVGGALGARSKDTSEIYITYKYNDVELTLDFRTGKHTAKVYSWINSTFA